MLKNLFTVCVAVICFQMGRLVVKRYSPFSCDNLSASQTEAHLKSGEKAVNAMRNQALDANTRLDGAKAGPGKSFTYNYTITQFKASEVNATVWYRDVVPTIKSQMKSNGSIRTLSKNGVTVRYRYSGSDGVFVGEIVMTPREMLN